MSVEYRAGLPTVEQVESHEGADGVPGLWMACGDWEAAPPTFIRFEVKRDGTVAEAEPDGEGDWQTVRDWRPFPGMRYRPCAEDGTPCPWPGEPSEGIDSLRRALSISDEKGRALAEEVERLRAGLALALEAVTSGDLYYIALGRAESALKDCLHGKAPQQTTEGKPHA